MPEPGSAASCPSPATHGSLGCVASAHLLQQCQYSVQMNSFNSHCPALVNSAFPLSSPCATSAHGAAAHRERHWQGKEKEMHWKTKERKKCTDCQVQMTPPGFAARKNRVSKAQDEPPNSHCAPPGHPPSPVFPLLPRKSRWLPNGASKPWQQWSHAHVARWA